MRATTTGPLPVGSIPPPTAGTLPPIFAATLYTCYEYIKPDLALEYAWRFNMYEFVMPFIIQMVSEMRTRENEVFPYLFRSRKSRPKRRRK